MQFHRHILAAYASDLHRALAGLLGGLAPIHADPNALFLLDLPLGGTQHDPGGTGNGSEIEWRLALIEYVDVMLLLIENVESRQGGIARGSRPCRGRPFDCHSHGGRLRQFDLFHRRHDIAVRLLPHGVADVRLVHHVVPLAVEQRVVVIIPQVGVGLEQGFGLRREIVGAGASLRPVQLILARGDVEFRHLRVRLGGVKHQFEERGANGLR